MAPPMVKFDDGCEWIKAKTGGSFIACRSSKWESITGKQSGMFASYLRVLKDDNPQFVV